MRDGQHYTVVVHVDVEQRVGALYLVRLSDDERRYLACDATYEAWSERGGQVIGSVRGFSGPAWASTYRRHGQ